MQFSFSDHVLDVDRRELARHGAGIAVEPQVFDLLVFLVENRNRVVTRDDLIESVWDGRIVSESTLASRINAARTALGDSGKDQRLIRTIPRKGFRFVAAVELHDASRARDDLSQVLAPAENPANEVVRGAVTANLPTLDRPAIAVLPFINMSASPDQEYFADGISEDVITGLSKLRWFYVIARNSTFIYKGHATNLKQLGAELGVGYVVEGSVRKEGDQFASPRS